MNKLGLIAGEGKFPKLVARNAKESGRKVVAVALQGITTPDLSKYVDKLYWIYIGQLGKLIKIFAKEGITEAVMAGKTPKTLMFSKIKPDLRAAAFFFRLKNRKDDSILKGVAEELAREGIMLQDSTTYISSMMPKEGLLTKRSPTKNELKDIQFGWEMAREMGRLDIGQCVVVKDLAVLAIEAIEGTDEAIKRGGKLGGEGSVAVKISKPNQDMRFDVPAVGIQTVKSLIEAKSSVLAVEAEKTIMFDQEEMVKLADETGISITLMKKA